MNTLDVFGLSAGYGPTRVIDGSLHRRAARSRHRRPNGVGKSTLVKVMLGLVPTARGRAHFRGRTDTAQPQRLAYVPQRSEIDWTIPRPRRNWWRWPSPPRHGLGWLRRPQQWRRRRWRASAWKRRPTGDPETVRASGSARCSAGAACAAGPDRARRAMAAIDRPSEALIWAELKRQAPPARWCWSCTTTSPRCSSASTPACCLAAARSLRPAARVLTLGAGTRLRLRRATPEHDDATLNDCRRPA